MSTRVSSNDVGCRPLSSSGGVKARRHESCFRFEPYQALTGNRLAEDLYHFALLITHPQDGSNGICASSDLSTVVDWQARSLPQ